MPLNMFGISYIHNITENILKNLHTSEVIFRSLTKGKHPCLRLEK